LVWGRDFVKQSGKKNTRRFISAKMAKGIIWMGGEKRVFGGKKKEAKKVNLF